MYLMLVCQITNTCIKVLFISLSEFCNVELFIKGIGYMETGYSYDNFFSMSGLIKSWNHMFWHPW